MFQQRMQGRVSQDDGVVISLGMKAQDTKMALVRRVIDHMREQLDSLERLLLQEEAADALQELAEVMSQQQSLAPQPFTSSSHSRVIEGVFDGIHMVGEDGKQYLVPPNYASKSKLVEGDLLRLVVTENGRFIFKQRGPIERQRLMGILTYNDQADEWSVVADGRKFRVLTASVTYFKAQPNDEMVILVPSGNPSSWAAVENVVRKDVGELEGV
jgi:hypothetical protein